MLDILLSDFSLLRSFKLVNFIIITVMSDICDASGDGWPICYL